MLSRGEQGLGRFLHFLANINVKTYSITKGLGLFLVDYSLHFGVRHQPRQLGHVYVNLAPTLQKV